MGGSGAATQVAGAARILFATATRAVAAAVGAGAHAVAAAASAAEVDSSAPPTRAASGTGGTTSDSSVPVDAEARHNADTAEDGDPAASASTQSGLDDKTAAFRAAPHKLKDRFLHYAERDRDSGEYVLTLEGFVRCMLLLREESTHHDEQWQRLADGSSGTTPPPQLRQPPPQTSPQVPETSAAPAEPSPAAAPPSFFARALGERRWGLRHARERRGGSASTSAAGTPTNATASWLAQLPTSVQQRFQLFFHWVDLDGTNSINYAEFVVLFTFLSTPQRTLQRAFRVFDLDDNDRLSEWEFCKLLNTIMVDPAVQVHCSGPVPNAESDATAPPTASQAAGATPDSPANPLTSTKAAPAPPTASPLPSAASLAGTSRRSTRARQRGRAVLNFELDSALMRPLLFGPLPRHVGAPPGSTHYDPSATGVAGSIAGAVGVSGTAGEAAREKPSRWRRWSQAVLHVVWPFARAKVNEACAADLPYGGPAVPPLPSTAAAGTPATTAAATATAAAAAPSSRMSQLHAMAREDTLLQMVSYPTFLYRLDYLRWELRAIEFGLCDPANTGAITLDDCRCLIRGDSRSAVAANSNSTTAVDAAPPTAPASDTSTRAGSAPGTLVTWQSYQKVFDVVKEADRVMTALQLTLDAMPPVPPETLRGGAIPDDALAAATAAIPALVRQSALRHAAAQSASATPSDSVGGEDNTGTQRTGEILHAASDAAPVTTLEHRGGEKDDGIDVPVVSADVLAAEAAEGKSVDEQRTAARRVQTSLVRPTALTWQQFNRVLASLGAAAQLSKVEAELFRALFDDDVSDSLSPAEFARVCSLKETFFAQQLPRFDEPKRNVIQQFFYCMQQLE